MGFLYRPPGSCPNAFLLLNAAIDHSSTLPGFTFVPGNLNATGVCWPSFTAPNGSLPFLLALSRGMNTARSRPDMKQKYRRPKFFDWNNAIRTSFESSFPARDHLPVSCTSIISFLSSLTSAISRPYYGTNWGHLTTLLRSCNWVSFFPAGEVQMATDKPYSFLHQCLGSIMQA